MGGVNATDCKPVLAAWCICLGLCVDPGRFAAGSCILFLGRPKDSPIDLRNGLHPFGLAIYVNTRESYEYSLAVMLSNL